MIAKAYQFALGRDAKAIERIMEDDNVAINRVVLEPQGALPEHRTNSNVYLIIVGGRLTVGLEEEAAALYEAGQIVNIPFRTNMRLSNAHDGFSEFFIVKAPGPATMQEK